MLKQWFGLAGLVIGILVVIVIISFALRKSDAEKMQEEIIVLDRLFLKLDTIPEIKPSSTDVSIQLAVQFDRDPEKLFRFVRDEIGYQVYRGILRGPSGTLSETAGNSLDQCVLLAELLKNCEPPVESRYVRGELDPETTKELIAFMFNRRKVYPDVSTETDLRNKALATLGIDQDIFENYRKNGLKKARDLSRETIKRSRSDLKRISQVIDKCETTIGPERRMLEREMETIAADHWWLQVYVDGQWIDMDPCFNDAQPGKVFGTVQKTSSTLDDQQYHRATVRIGIEQLIGNTVHEHIVYQQKKRICDLYGKPISINVIPEDPEIAGIALPATKSLPDSAGNRELLRYQPVVFFGTEVEYGLPFDLDGNKYLFRSGSFQSASEKGFMTLGARIWNKGEDQDGQILSLWIELEAESPGENSELIRRMLFDRTETAAASDQVTRIADSWKNPNRLKFAPMISYEILPVVSRFSDTFLSGELARPLFDERDFYRAAIRSKYDAEAVSIADLSETTGWFPMNLVMLAQVASDLLREFVPEEAAYYHARPDYYAFEERIDMGKDEQLVLLRGFDIISSGIRVAVPEKVKYKPDKTMPMYGILLSNLEVILGEEMMPDTVPFSTHTIMDLAGEQDVGWIALPPGSQDKIAALAIGTRARNLIRNELESGFTVVVPERNIVFRGEPVTAWWRVDPATGNVVGMTDQGRGQSLIELNSIINDVAIPAVQRCMKYVACLNKAILGGSSLQEAGADCMMVFMKDFTIDTAKAFYNWGYFEWLEYVRGKPLAWQIQVLLSMSQQITDTFQAE
ncbi:hypothetical protein JXA40_05990 [bacterium]|nr:hypothetical protein [candidate division CSSED10-310 bacterium]